MKKNIFVTGKPGSGKTTLLLNIYKKLDLPFCGYYTTYLIANGVKKGYVINNFRGGKGIFAHVDSPSELRISKYGLDLDVFELIAANPIEECLEYLPRKIIIMDEIGKKEFMSQKFRNVFFNALSSKNIVLASVTLRKNFPLNDITKRDDTLIFEINQNNRSNIENKITETIKELHKQIKIDPLAVSEYAKLMEN